ncbi:transcriptional regulator with HTH domain and aminotransferase domain [Xenococcus sp. PCC 7305]|uniref:MocR-like pyridoxine biosynthesis transcription factor PdxR n=1 Tax=Xenococcus sp. PCC 7305 TaxID=102125 RepID=UPI0002AC23CA|nr:PLP-dependent aminotransferase family protein [Xenococcus sp. PCC 7305]ELS03226.1 transcriptional regulator with HTH domain and aminotransferase domain [Xenococcus sp. PCC 7305]
MDLAIHLKSNSPIPLYQQLTEKIRTAILEGRLQPKQKLPSSRSLAKSLMISRSTVIQCYEQLASEGYLETRSGSGTYVCHQIPDEWLNAQPIEPVTNQIAQDLTLSQFGKNLISVGSLEVSEPGFEISFRYGNPANGHFPLQLWRKFLNRYCDSPTALLNYAADAAGHFPLRVAIANYLRRSRAVCCNPKQVIIVNGSQQALNLIARLTLNPGDWLAMEDPGYLGARKCFSSQSANLQPIPINSEGLNIDLLTQCNRNFKLVYVTPSHQFPTGVTLTLRQRIALLQWAQTTGTLIIEDDYDSEFRYGEQPIPALQGMDKSESVIYVGTFSKTMFPSLRIGYLVVPDSWISLVRNAKWLCDRVTPLLEQYALTDWIIEGHFERHIRRMRKLYNLRRQVLIRALEKYFGDRVTILGANAGIHVMVRIETGLCDRVILQKAAAVGVGLISAREYYLKPQDQGEFIFGYAQLTEIKIEQGICKLSQILEISN